MKTIRTFCTLLALFAALSATARKVEDFCSGWTFTKMPASLNAMQTAARWNAAWDSVSVPHTWNAADMQRNVNNFYEGVGYYAKDFEVPEAWKGKCVYLRFEGVGACAEVYVNNRLVGSHKGAYGAFVCDISRELSFGKTNKVLVKADNTARPDVIPVNHNLFGVYGGIYRPVSLIITEPCRIAVDDCASPGVTIRQRAVSRSSAKVSVQSKLRNARLRSQQVTVETSIADARGKQVAKSVSTLSLSAQGQQTCTADFSISHPHLWQGRDDPYLYRVSVRLYDAGTLIDEVVQPLGLRTVEVRAGEGVFLNGSRYPMYGVTRHQDWWGKGSALTAAEHDSDLVMIMDVGATTIRLAHYQQSDYFYSRCDTLGLLVWAEIPFVNRVTGQEWDNAHTQLRELIRQSRNHPSIYVWGLHNEVYQPHSYTASLTASLSDLAHTEDPDRPTASVNGYGHASHPVNGQADIQGMNRYYGWYEKRINDMDAWVEGLEKDYPEMKLMLTEYGADGNPAQQTELLGESLDWTGKFYPETFETKTHEYQWSVIAKHPYITSSYLWNMFDFACPMWERGGVAARNQKGLVTFDRRVKKDAYYWYKANWSPSPVLYITQRRNTERERRTTSVTVYSNRGEPAVYLNGQRLSGIRKGYTDVHYIVEGVTLADGENIIRSEVTDKNGEMLTDEVRWNYHGEQQRGAEAGKNNAEHFGF